MDAVDKVALRREARRRKILENAKGRLEQLNGRTTNSGSASASATANITESRDYSDPEVEPDILPRHTEPAPAAQPPQLNFPTDYSEIFNSWSTTSQPPKTKKHFLLLGRAHILLAAAVSYLVTMWRWHKAEPIDDNENNSFSIFLPVGLILVLELIFFRGQQQMSPFLNLLFTLCGIQPQKINRFLHFFNTVQSLVIDMGLFIFFFCSLSFLLSCVHAGFMNSITIK